MVHGGCVVVAGIYPSRTWMSGSFESMWWNAHMNRLDLYIPVHTLIRKSFFENGVRTHVNSKGKIPSTRGSEEGWTPGAAPCRTESPTLPTELFQPRISNTNNSWNKMVCRVIMIVCRAIPRIAYLNPLFVFAIIYFLFVCLFVFVCFLQRPEYTQVLSNTSLYSFL